MSYLSRQNPFIRTSLLNRHQKEKVEQYNYQPTSKQKNSQLNLYPRSNYQSAEHYGDNFFTNHKAFDKSQVSRDREGFSHDKHTYQGTFFPLSRYQNRLKLRQYDKQIWKRQKSKQQRYKLEHFGSEALRYSSYSIANSLDTKQTNYWNKDKEKVNNKRNQNRNGYDRLYNGYHQQQTNKMNANQYYIQSSQHQSAKNHHFYGNKSQQADKIKASETSNNRDKYTGYQSSPYNDYMLSNKHEYIPSSGALFNQKNYSSNSRYKNNSYENTNLHENNRQIRKQMPNQKEVQKFQKQRLNDSFSKNNEHIHYQKSQQKIQQQSKGNQSLESSGNDLIADDMYLQPGKGTGSKMSYGSNLQSIYRRANMGNTDNINEHESSFHNEQYRKVFGGENERLSFNKSGWQKQEQKVYQVPSSIRYLNREFFNIKI